MKKYKVRNAITKRKLLQKRNKFRLQLLEITHTNLTQCTHVKSFHVSFHKFSLTPEIITKFVFHGFQYLMFLQFLIAQYTHEIMIFSNNKLIIEIHQICSSLSTSHPPYSSEYE